MPQYSITKPSNPWARISEVAAKVGVKSRQPNDPPSIIATGADGKEYDVWEVVIGVFNKLEA